MKDPNSILQKALARNEPVFVIRAQDKISLAALAGYLHAARLLPKEVYSNEQYQELMSIYEKFEQWQNDPNNLTKIPD